MTEKLKTKTENLAKPMLTTVFLAPYLPYKLKFRVKATGQILEMNSLNYRCVGVFKFEDIEIILKPISDLEKKIYNDFENYDIVINNRHSSLVFSQEIIDLFCFEYAGIDEKISNYEDFSFLPYDCLIYMFKNHYDVNGLIEKGLAVSIHDVEQHCG